MYVSKGQSIATLSLSTEFKRKSKWNMMNDVTEYSLGGSKGIVIDGRYHVIGGWRNHRHLVFNPQSHKLDTLHDFDGYIGMGNIARILRMKNKLFVCDTVNMHEYDIGNDKWKKMDVTMPNFGRGGFEATVAFKKEYILLFDRGESHGIWIYSVHDKKLTKSKLKCPGSYSHLQAFSIHNKEDDELAVFGFVRRQWKLSEIADYLFPPYYLLKLMHGFYWNECVHLIGQYDGKHWRIDIFDILD